MSFSEPEDTADAVVHAREPISSATQIHDELVRLLFKNSLDAIVVTDEQGHYIDVNAAACDLFGYSREEMLHLRVHDLLTHDYPDAAAQYENYLRTGKRTGEFTFVRPDAQVRIVSYAACRLGAKWHVSILHDITSRKSTEEALRASEKRTRLATEAAGLGIWEWNASADQVTWENDRMYEIFGLSLSDPPVNAARFVAEFLHPEDAAAFAQAIAVALETDASLYFTGRFRRRDGQIRWVEFTGRLDLTDAAAPKRMVGTAADITERREAEAALEALNVRLARAMQETHHRVKNNLQVIAALIEMEEGRGDSAAHLRRIKQHTLALALIHDILTGQAKGKVPNTSDVSAKEVLGRLVPILDQASGEQRIRADIDHMTLPVQKAASLTLLVNECVSNAIKHGTGDIEITLRIGEQPTDRKLKEVRLEVCDDGPGFPPHFDPRLAANTGLELIESSARWDLRGEVFYENRTEGGARVLVTFSIPHSAED